MEKEKVLIVDDESYIREFVAEVLSSNYQTIFARDGKEALELVRNQSPAAIILDMMMPGHSGLDVVKVLRQNPETEMTPVLVLTALDDTSHRIDCYASGVDDYIAKPFHPAELLSRVQSKIARVKKSRGEETYRLQMGPLSLDLINHVVQIEDQPIHLGTIEFKILHCLMKTPAQIVDRQILNQFVWGNELPSERAMDPHITALRKKLGNSAIELKTIYGQGYSLHMKMD